MVYEWKNKVVLITGAASGIGAVVTRYLMDEEVKHIAILDIKEKAGVELQNELNSQYGINKVKFYKCDVSNDEELLGSFDAVAEEQGYLDVVVNNAGIMNDGLDVYRKEIQINLTALVTGTIKAMEIMGKDKGGKGGAVINVSSIAALYQCPILPIYYSTKSAVLQFSNCIGMEQYFSRTGVRVLAICFGATDTPLLHLDNVGNFNQDIYENIYVEEMKSFPLQKVENAAQGVVDVFKVAESGSTWISTSERPLKDITASVKKAYDLLSVHVFE